MLENKLTLVLGGCRSGKSTYAQQLAEKVGGRKVFIATLKPYDDDEMKDRIARHQADRGDDWETVEASDDLVAAVENVPENAGVVLIDCLTLWVSNMLLADDPVHFIESESIVLSAALREVSCPVILVSNEVGHGVVPDNRLGRDFRDAAGMVNQEVAACCGTVVLMTAGIPQIIKS